MRAVIVFLAGLGLVLIALTGLLLRGGLPDLTEPRVTQADARTAVTGALSPTPQEWQRLEKDAAKGDPVAMNNLGVALWRSRQKADKDAARGWFEQAAERGDVAARYNLALMLPNRFDTEPEIIERRLSLLTQNVELGDIPSMVALAESLYFVNRDAYVADRKGTIRQLLKTAAATGDSDYLVIYGKTLWRGIRGSDDASPLIEALAALRLAYEKGDPRGAETMGDIMASGQSEIRAIVADADLETDPLLWYRRAGDMGLTSARCHHGLRLFRTGEWVRTPDMGLIERHFRAGPAILGNDPEIVARAIDDLKHCADPPRRQSRPNRPFGAPSLYAFKLRGTWTSMANSPGWANITLGVLYGYGIGVPRDHERAVTYLDVAHEKHGFDLAKQIKLSLPAF